MTKKTKAEEFFGHPLTNGALTLIAAATPGMPIAALLPLLSNTLAESRHKTRVEKTLREINQTLDAHQKQLKNLTDNQYKLINEIVLAVLQTTNSNKLVYLKNAVKNSLLAEIQIIDDGVILSRIIRDISADEVNFLIKNFSYEKIEIGASTSEMPNNVLRISSNSKEEVICSGLISLGLIIPSGATMSDMGLNKFSNLVAKVIALLQD